MVIGVREEWIDHVVAACTAVEGHAAPHRTRSARRVFAEFETQLPAPRSSAENAVLRALLVDVAVRWGHADHDAYHVEFPDAECADDPAALAMNVWRAPRGGAHAAFRHWCDTYIGHMERVHPRYRAVELRRELDAEFARPLSVARLAKSRGVSTRCLQRDFQELTGMTVQDYVTERRLDAASGLLQNTSDKVEWIASVVGWSSRKNLNRALARRRGVNPEDLRR